MLDFGIAKRADRNPDAPPPRPPTTSTAGSIAGHAAVHGARGVPTAAGDGRADRPVLAGRRILRAADREVPVRRAHLRGGPRPGAERGAAAGRHAEPRGRARALGGGRADAREGLGGPLRLGSRAAARTSPRRARRAADPLGDGGGAVARPWPIGRFIGVPIGAAVLAAALGVVLCDGVGAERVAEGPERRGARPSRAGAATTSAPSRWVQPSG